MTTESYSAPLSPQTQTVLDAFFSASICAEVKLAAALRAAADQVVPVPIDAKTPEEHWSLLGVKNKLLAIVDEIDETNNTSESD